MPDYTIITTENTLQVGAARFTFDADGDLYCYEGDDAADDDVVAHVPANRFVAIFESDHGTIVPRSS